MHIPADLFRYVINDQEQSQNALNFLTSWVNKLCLQKNCYLTLIDVGNIDEKSSCDIHDTQNEQMFKIHLLFISFIVLYNFTQF